jgi:hypothetical protein
VALTTDQLEDFYFDLGLSYGSVFTTDEANRCYTRAGGDYDKALVYAVRALRADAAKLHDYRAATASESLSQVFRQLGDLLKDVEARAGMGGAVLQIGNIGLNIDATSDNMDEWDETELTP